MRAIENSPATVGGLRPAGCRQESSAEPVGFGLAGCADGTRNFACLIRSQTHGKDLAQSVLFCQTWPAHFLSHKKRLCVYIKSLTSLHFPFTRSPALKVEAELFPEKCPHVPGKVSNQRHPAVTGAGSERLAMKARSLKIEKTGDFFKGKIIPRIRIAGQWLEQAGFKPGQRVEVRCEQAGVLTLRFVEQAQEVAL